ncbi:exopolysaccharide biosynthesis polyprenyl glycosylphosphotransferase [Amedibacillus sp. YH-ame6]
MKENILNFKRTILLLIRFLNFSIMIALFAYAWYSYYSDLGMLMTVTGFFRKGDILLVAVYAILLIAFTQLNGGYKVGDYRISEMMYSNAISILFINAIYYLFISLIWRGFPNPMFLVITTFVQFFYAGIWSIYSNRLYYKLYKARKIIYFYQGDEPSSTIKKLKRYRGKYNVKEIVQVNDEYDFDEHIKSFEGVFIDSVDPDIKRKCIRACYTYNKRLYLVPSIEDIILESSAMINLLDSPLYLMRNRGLSLEQLLVKRIVDLIICVPIFIVTLPIMLITAIAIKAEDHGPVFYKQTRLTLHAKEFKIIKFRSMRIDAEKDGKAVLMQKNDDRITKVGKFIRKCRIDELPQLLNVIKGDMTIIGPRPERPEIADEYYKTMPEFKFRLNGKAGITGYAQVMGKYNTTPYDKLSFDLMYLENYNLMFDVKIALLTLKTLFDIDATEGVDENK